MKRSSYHEPNYAFGQTLLTLRTTARLTQAGVAEELGVSRKAVGEWEAGLNYPQAAHLRAFIALAVEKQAFPAGREEEEIRTLWQAARRKVPLDEAWLSGLLPGAQALPASQPDEETPRTSQALAPAEGGPRVDWGDALVVTTFYGREWEQNLLTSWIVEERCRVVSVLGLGGIGKSALSTRMMHRVAEHFEVVIWRSLREAPTCEGLLGECLQVLVPQALRDVSMSLERRLGLLLESLRATRVLLVLDNLEALLEEGQSMGHMRAGYEGYAQLLRRIAGTEHQSCLLLTSREKPSDLVPLEGSRAPVRVLRLGRLDTDACQQVLAEKEVAGSVADHTRLIEAYEGNPLALKIVAQTIVDLFDGQIAPFLEQGEVVFGGVRELLDEQYARLADHERMLLGWLAIAREPASIQELLGGPLSRSQGLEAIEGLRRRSLIERGQRQGSFTLQSVVLEYVTARRIMEMTSEIEQGRSVRLSEHGLELATAKEYVRQAQKRLLVTRLLAQLRKVFRGRAEVERNLLVLLRELRGHLRGLDLSRLSIRGASLQGVEMQDTTLAEATLRDTTFTEALDATRAVAISRDGRYWAAGSWQGKVRVWQQGGKSLHLAWQAHTDTVSTLAFSPDGQTLATGSWDGALKLWDVKSGDLLWTNWRTNTIQTLAFAPDGQLLASGGNDATVQLWDAHRGTHRQALPSESGAVYALAWSPDGRLLASGGLDGSIRLWEVRGVQPEVFMWKSTGHTDWVFALAFAPDGRILASCGFDQMIWLWDVERGSYRMTLQGHMAAVHGLAFTPDSHILLSGSDDGTIRVWDVVSGQCIHIIQGYSVSLYDVAWSPDGTQLASAGSDTLVTIWEVERRTPPRLLYGHSWIVHGVAWSPDGKFLASGSYQRGVYVWEVATGTCHWVSDTPPTIIRRIEWSPDGTHLASCSDEGSVCLWDASDGHLRVSLQGHSGMVKSVAWSPDGTRLASGGGGQGSGEIVVWDAHSGERLSILSGRGGMTYALAWDPSGGVLISGGGDGVLRWWDVQSGECMRMREAHQGKVQQLRCSPDGAKLASCGDDGTIRLWDLHRGEHLHTLRRDRPYERLTITGIKGLSEAQKASLHALGAFGETNVGR